MNQTHFQTYYTILTQKFENEINIVEQSRYYGNKNSKQFWTKQRVVYKLQI